MGFDSHGNKISYQVTKTKQLIEKEDVSNKSNCSPSVSWGIANLFLFLDLIFIVDFILWRQTDLYNTLWSASRREFTSVDN